jgi:hypothetical protein
MLDRLRTAMSVKQASSADTGAAVAEAEAALAEAHAEVGRLEGERRELLTAPDAERSRNKQARAAAQDHVRDAADYLDALQTKRAESEARETEEAKRAAYDQAKVQSEAAAKLLAKEYPELGKRFGALIRTVAEAGAAVQAVNMALPEGAAALDGPEETVRDVPALPRKELARKRIKRWVYADNGLPVHELTIPNIAPGVGRTGHFVSGGLGEAPKAVEQRPFDEVEFLPASRPVGGPRLYELNIPSLRPGNPDVWRATGYMADASQVLRILDACAAEAASSSGDHRQPETEFQSVG